MTIPQWKGKAWDLRLRQNTGGVEGDGGPDGIVLPLNVVGSGVYDVYVSMSWATLKLRNFWNLNTSAYVLPIKVGKNAQTFSLQVDTGSSDLVCIFGLYFFSHLLHSFLLTLFRLPNFSTSMPA